MAVPHKSVTFSYLRNDPIYQTEKPYYYSGPLPTDQEHLRTNLRYDLVDGVPIRDLRGHEKDISFEEDGFEIITDWTVHSDFSNVTYDQDEARWLHVPIEEYLEEVAEMVRRRLNNAEVVLPYNYKVRRNDGVQASCPSSATESITGAADTPHIDQTKEGGPRRIKRHLSRDEWHKFSAEGRRLRIVNVWRPLSLVQNAPLAICSRSSITSEQLMAADRVIPEYAGEIYYITQSQGQKWNWLSNQQPNEAWIFVSFDSRQEDVFWGCPHAAFDLDINKGELPRESIEVRVIVVDGG